MEAVVTVGILTVLVAIALPIFQGWREKTQAAACQGQVASLQTRMTVLRAKERLKSVEEVWAEVQEEVGTKGCTCPSDGESYLLNENGEPYCPYHTPTGIGILDNVGEAIQNVWADIKSTFSGRIDSTALAANNSSQQKLYELLDADGFSLRDSALSWSIYQDGGAVCLAWTDTSVKDLADGTKFIVYVYNLEHETTQYRHIYSVWCAESVTQTVSVTGGTTSYQVIQLYKEYPASTALALTDKADFSKLSPLYAQAQKDLADGTWKP